MAPTPLVTIGLPVYNSERFVRQSIDSLLAQTYSEFVLIINDNASTDSTQDICKQYAERDARVKYHRNATNIGNPRNFNRVFELTQTRYLKWSTADDFWAPTFLERAVEIMERDPSIALCYPQAYLVDAEGGNAQPYEDCLNLPQPDPADRFLTLIDSIKLAHQHLGLIRTDCLRQTHLLGTYSGSDIALLAELALYGKFYELPERLFYRRFHQTSGSWKRGDAQHEAKYYYAAGAKKTGGVKWRHLLRLFAAAAARRAPLSLRSRLRIYRHLVRHVIWSRRQLLGELLGNT
jgi:glycosyltransferase involved in cell wall biosynthesis